MAERRAYLDHAATTPMRPEAREAMLPYLSGAFGNPSGAHHESRRARRAVDDARERLADLLGADLGEVVFTSGGTEADNLAVTGGWKSVAAARRSSPPIVCSAIEHHAVLQTCRALAQESGAELREVPADRSGVVDADAWAGACTPDVGLVSVMAVNNELGTVQNLQQLAERARAGSPFAVLHTDAVQAAPWMDVGRLTRQFDLVSISAHKFGGPQGVGALVVRGGTGLVAQATGGGQERERRSGTHNVAGIVAMTAALDRTSEALAADNARVAARPRPPGRRTPGRHPRVGLDGVEPGGARLLPSAVRRGRERVPGRAARCVRCGCFGRRGLLQWCRRGQPCTPGHGVRPGRSDQRHPILPRVDDQRGGHRPGAVGRPGCGRQAARLRTCECWWPCRVVWTRR